MSGEGSDVWAQRVGPLLDQPWEIEKGRGACVYFVTDRPNLIAEIKAAGFSVRRGGRGSSIRKIRETTHAGAAYRQSKKRWDSYQVVTPSGRTCFVSELSVGEAMDTLCSAIDAMSAIEGKVDQAADIFNTWISKGKV